MAEMKNICGKIPVELHEKVRAEIEEKETSTQIFIRQVIEEHFNRLENKGEAGMEKRTLAVQVTEELFQRVKWAITKEGVKQKDFIIRIIEKAVEEVEAKWQELDQPEEIEETDNLEEAVKKILWFYRGGKAEKKEEKKERYKRRSNRGPAFSFSQDAPYIYAAFKEQYGFEFPTIVMTNGNTFKAGDTITMLVEYSCMERIAIGEEDIGHSLRDIFGNSQMIIGYSHSGTHSKEKDEGFDSTGWYHTFGSEKNVYHLGIKAAFVDGEVVRQEYQKPHTYNGLSVKNTGAKVNPLLWFKAFRTAA